MHISISKKSDVSIGEQLTTQIILAIASNDLAPRQKLPSTRELSRRLEIHANTVSAAYRELSKKGWLEFRPGSGVYVRELKGNVHLEGCLEVDQMISAFLRLARERGFTLEQIRARARLWIDLQPPDHFLVIDPDPDLRAILKKEISWAAHFPAEATSVDDLPESKLLTGAIPVALFGQAEEVRAVLPHDTSLMLIHTRCVHEQVKKLKALPRDTFVTVVSRWPGFLRWARPLLVASDVDPGILSFRDPREKGWQAGLGAVSLVVTDCVTASMIPAKCQTLVFHIVAESSLNELKSYIEDFLPPPHPKQ